MAELGPKHEHLSPRERQIAEAYAAGQSYREIAERLFIAPTTVRTHLGTIYRKLGVSTKVELLRTLERDGSETVGIGRAEKADAARTARTSHPERRQVTVLSATVLHQGDQFDRLEAEDLHAILSAFLENFDQTVRRMGGAVINQVGNSFLAVFGAPIAHGNDAERALRTSISLHRSIAGIAGRLGWALSLHIGAAAGSVLFFPSSSRERNNVDIKLTGDPLSVALCLSETAHDGATLVDENVLRELHYKIYCDAPRSVEAKGLKTTIRAFPFNRFRGSQLERPLIGRAPEMALMNEVLSAARATGRGETIEVVAEAGIGKSRLADEIGVAASSMGYRVHKTLVLDFGLRESQEPMTGLLASLCDLVEDPPPAPVRSLVGKLSCAGVLDRVAAIFLTVMLGATPEGSDAVLYEAMDGAARMAGRKETLRKVVVHFAAQQPILLVVEDIHWADPIALELISVLRCETARNPLVVVLTARPDGVANLDRLADEREVLPPRRLRLGPLPTTDALALAKATGVLSSDAVIRQCVELSQGNPLFLDQLLHHAHESGRGAIPGSIQSLIQARVDRLSRTDRRILKAAAVLGQRFTVGAAAWVAEVERYDEQALLEARLIRPFSEDFLFAHALIREATQRMILRDDLKRLNRRAAEWYGAREPILFAEHLDRAADPRAPRAYLAAAEVEANAYRNQVALRLAERGLQLAGEPADRFALAAQLADILHDMGRMDAALAAYEAAFQTAVDDGERCQVWIGLAAVQRVTDRLDEAWDNLNRAEAAAKRLGLKAALARIYNLRGNLCFPQGDIEGCIGWQTRSLAVAREEAAPDLEASALGGIGDAEFARGRMRSALQQLQRCISVCETHGLKRIAVANQAQVAHAQLYAETQQGALKTAVDAAANATLVGNRRAELMAHLAAAYAAFMLLDSDTAQEELLAAEDLIRRLGAWRFEAPRLYHVARLALLEEDREDAVRALREAQAVGQRVGVGTYGANIEGGLALALSKPEERRRALAAADALVAAGRAGYNQLRYYPDAIDAALQLGDADAADRFADALETYTRDEKLPWSEFFISRGRLLARHLRGLCDEKSRAALIEVRKRGEKLGLRAPLAAVDATLSASFSN